MTTLPYTFSTGKIDPVAERLLARLAPQYNPLNGTANLLVLAPVPMDLAMAPRPVRLEPYQRELERGDVKHFRPEKGYGHFDTQEGDLFFHASGYRLPSVREHREDGKVRHLLQLEKLPRTNPEDDAEAPVLSIPTLTKGTPVLFLRGVRKSSGNVEKLAQIWTLQEPYQEFVEAQEAAHEAALNDWIQLARYRLTLQVTVPGLPQLVEGMVIQGDQVHESLLFHGTETNMLKDWYKHYKDVLQLGPHRKVTLSYSEYQPAQGQHGPWQVCDPETMEDFLG